MPPKKATPGASTEDENKMSSTDQLLEMFQTLFRERQNTRWRPARKLPSFGGTSTECPNKFLSTIKRIFEENEVHEDDYVETFVEQLIGEAKQWATPLLNLQIPWGQLTRQFLAHFNSAIRQTQLRQRFFGQEQGEEEAAAHMRTKCALWMRLESLEGHIPEDIAVRSSIELLQPEFRRFMRLQPPTTFEMAIEQLTLLDQDIPVQENQATRTISTTRKTSEPWCKYCSQHHFYRNCPKSREHPAEPVGERQRSRAIAPSAANQIEAPNTTLPRVPVTIGGKTVWALLDSAASRNFLRESPSASIRRHNGHVSLAAEGQKMRTTGETEASIQIDGHNTEVVCDVSPDLHEECILGYPWFKDQGAFLDFRQECLHFGKGQRRTINWKARKEEGTSRLLPPAAGELNAIPEGPSPDLTKRSQQLPAVPLNPRTPKNAATGYSQDEALRKRKLPLPGAKERTDVQSPKAPKHHLLLEDLKKRQSAPAEVPAAILPRRGSIATTRNRPAGLNRGKSPTSPTSMGSHGEDQEGSKALPEIWFNKTGGNCYHHSLNEPEFPSNAAETPPAKAAPPRYPPTARAARGKGQRKGRKRTKGRTPLAERTTIQRPLGIR